MRDEPLTLSEQQWLGSAQAELLNLISYREKGAPGAHTFCVFSIGDAYVQFLALPFSSRDAICEVASARSVPALKSILTPEKIDKLTHQYGFSVPGRSPNYAKKINMVTFEDVLRMATEALHIFTEIYDVRSFENAEFKLRVPNPTKH